MPIAEGQWGSKLSATSRPAGSSLTQLLASRQPRPSCRASPSGQATQREVSVCQISTKALPRLGFSMCCLTCTPRFFLTQGPLRADSYCCSPGPFIQLHNLCFRMLCALPLVLLSSLWLLLSLTPLRTQSVPPVLESLSWHLPCPACPSYTSFLCIPCYTGPDPCCSIHAGLSTFAHLWCNIP